MVCGHHGASADASWGLRGRGRVVSGGAGGDQYSRYPRICGREITRHSPEQVVRIVFLGWTILPVINFKICNHLLLKGTRDPGGRVGLSTG